MELLNMELLNMALRKVELPNKVLERMETTDDAQVIISSGARLCLEWHMLNSQAVIGNW